jgi:ubiquinone/menaquinone biosynthesis C-methylase UbiE
MPTAYYDDPDYDYQHYWSNRSYENQAEYRALRCLLKNLVPIHSLIDIGAGFGRLVPVYKPYTTKITLAEPSQRMLAKAKQLYNDYHNIEYLRAFAEDIPMPDQTFDTGLMVRTLHHLENPETVFWEINRLLKPHGYLILEIPNKIHFIAKIRAFLKGNFKFAQDQNRTTVGTPGNHVAFYNYHPEKIKQLLSSTGFQVQKILSVSNLRHPFLKKIIPLALLIKIEQALQQPLAKYYFGPSLFILCQKKK